MVVLSNYDLYGGDALYESAQFLWQSVDGRSLAVYLAHRAVSAPAADLPYSGSVGDVSVDLTAPLISSCALGAPVFISPRRH
jgi:hypothetical protein